MNDGDRISALDARNHEFFAGVAELAYPLGSWQRSIAKFESETGNSTVKTSSKDDLDELQSYRDVLSESYSEVLSGPVKDDLNALGALKGKLYIAYVNLLSKAEKRPCLIPCLDKTPMSVAGQRGLVICDRIRDVVLHLYGIKRTGITNKEAMSILEKVLIGVGKSEDVVVSDSADDRCLCHGGKHDFLSFNTAAALK